MSIFSESLRKPCKKNQFFKNLVGYELIWFYTSSETNRGSVGITVPQLLQVRKTSLS